MAQHYGVVTFGNLPAQQGRSSLNNQQNNSPTSSIQQQLPTQQQQPQQQQRPSGPTRQMSDKAIVQVSPPPQQQTNHQPQVYAPFVRGPSDPHINATAIAAAQQPKPQTGSAVNTSRGKPTPQQPAVVEPEDEPMYVTHIERKPSPSPPNSVVRQQQPQPQPQPVAPAPSSMQAEDEPMYVTHIERPKQQPSAPTPQSYQQQQPQQQQQRGADDIDGYVVVQLPDGGSQRVRKENPPPATPHQGGQQQIAAQLHQQLQQQIPLNPKAQQQQQNQPQMYATVNFSLPTSSLNANIYFDPKWYYGSLGREASEALLKKSVKRVFLVRDSTQFKGAFSLSKYDPYFPSSNPADHFGHLLIESSPAWILKASKDNAQYNSINDLIARTPVLAGFIPLGDDIPK